MRRTSKYRVDTSSDPRKRSARRRNGHGDHDGRLMAQGGQCANCGAERLRHRPCPSVVYLRCGDR
ncbi:50S ribosomal protein L32 [Agrobacterium vitis]|uniref:50S ribosomal protein L32 n=1 Tax=Agrobacterium vitis TaxID=373 RepID=UPI003B527556